MLLQRPGTAPGFPLAGLIRIARIWLRGGYMLATLRPERKSPTLRAWLNACFYMEARPRVELGSTDLQSGIYGIFPC